MLYFVTKSRARFATFCFWQANASSSCRFSPACLVLSRASWIYDSRHGMSRCVEIFGVKSPACCMQPAKYLSTAFRIRKSKHPHPNRCTFSTGEAKARELIQWTHRIRIQTWSGSVSWKSWYVLISLEKKRWWFFWRWKPQVHRAARGGDSKAATKKFGRSRFVEENQWKYMEALIAIMKGRKKHLHLEYIEELWKDL